MRIGSFFGCSILISIGILVIYMSDSLDMISVSTDIEITIGSLAVPLYSFSCQNNVPEIFQVM